MKKTFKVPVCALCEVSGYVIVEAETEDEAVEKAVSGENFVHDIEPDLDNFLDWEFTDDWDSVEELTRGEVHP